MFNAPYPWQEKPWQSLLDTEKAGRLPHALLLSGMRGIGKLDFANALAAKLLCASEDNINSTQTCGKCHPCMLSRAGTHPDILSIGLSEKSKVLKADDLRAWLVKTQLSPMIAKQKIAIVNDADQMTMQAANSFLKILEEPAGNTTFILVSHKTKPILPTIHSRCQTVSFTEPKLSEAKPWLKTLLPEEDIETLWTMANGAPLQMLSYHQEEKVAEYLELVKQLAEVKQSEVFGLSAQWSKEALPELLRWWQTLVFMLMKKNFVPDSTLPPAYKVLVLQENTMIMFYDKLLEARKMLSGNINPRLLLDDLLLSWVAVKG